MGNLFPLSLTQPLTASNFEGFLGSTNPTHKRFYEKVVKVKADVAALHCLISVFVRSTASLSTVIAP
jgi:hypothetical protein